MESMGWRSEVRSFGGESLGIKVLSLNLRDKFLKGMDKMMLGNVGENIFLYIMIMKIEYGMGGGSYKMIEIF